MINFLTSKGLKILKEEYLSDSITIEFLVGAKPGSKKEKIYIGDDGALMVQTRARPVEGEANAAIIEMVGKAFGTAKSRVNIIRGETSKKKTIQLRLELSKDKNENFFLSKITSSLADES